MKLRYCVILILLLLAYPAKSQPAETIYPGNLIANGYLNNIPLTGSSDGPFPIGFNFTFYGNSYSNFYVSANGLVMFTDPASFYSTEAAIPTAALPNNFIAPFWDDLTISATGNVLYRTIGVAPNRKLIIQFKNMGIYPFPIHLGTFSVILFEGSNNIRIQYRMIVDPNPGEVHGGSATIGIENSDGTSGIQHSYHNPSGVSSEQSLLFTPSGSTYTEDSNALYDGVFLTNNESLPDPEVSTLINPDNNAVTGVDQTFSWSAAANTADYILLISESSDLTGGTSYSTATGLSHDVTGLNLNTTYYWGVYTTNAAATTWCEIKKFTTSSAPPLAAVPQTIWTEQLQDKTIKLNFTGGDAGPKTAIVTSLPSQGQLYQYVSGARGSIISSVPVTITDPDRNIIYAASGGFGNGAGNFNYKINDGTGDSPDATITINVSPPEVPEVLYIAKNPNVEIQFDIPMADPAGKQGQFTVTVNGTPATVNSAGLKPGDPNTIILTLATPLTGSETVLVAYTMGNISGSTGGLLFSFADQTVTLRAQIITFPIIPVKKYGTAPFSPGATASSGLGITYSSSNLAVATSSGSTVTLQSVGSSDITARQAGNGTFAPAKYTRSLTVIKGDQTITFNALPSKTLADPDFTLTATASSGLGVSYSGDNNSVATITGNVVHIVGVGSVVITASQPGNSNYNAAADVPQTLLVTKISQTITFGVLPAKTFGDADFNLSATSSSGLSVSFSGNNNSVATVTGNLVHIVGAGSVVITASQAGNSDYFAAPDVLQTLTVNKANQTITFDVLAEKTYGDADFTPVATSSSGLSVGFASDNSSVATIVGGQIHIVGAGTAKITASQPGDDNYNAAVPVDQTLTVNKADQTITFSPIPGKKYGDGDFALTASSSSGLSIGFVSDNPPVADVTGNVVHIFSSGTATITASQAGNDNYNPATSIPQTLTVGKADLTFTADNKSRAYLTENPELTFTISGFVNGDTHAETNPSIYTTALLDSPAGDYPITFSGGSDPDYNFIFVEGTLTITRLQQTITLSDYPTRLLQGDTYTLVATSSSGLPVSFESSDNTITTITGDQITGVSKGNADIRVFNAGNESYEPAEISFAVEIYSTHKDIMHLFTPNNDGINDYWELPEMPTWGNCDVKVYSRNGKLVFSDPNYNNLWDGTSNGNPLPEGAYYFIIKTENSGMIKGTVNIVR